MNKPEQIEEITYDWDHNGLIREIVEKLNDMIRAINYLLQKA
jgi:hypothetical protein